MPTDEIKRGYPRVDRDLVVLQAAQCIIDCADDSQIRGLAREIKAMIERKEVDRRDILELTLLE